MYCVICQQLVCLILLPLYFGTDLFATEATDGY